MLNYPTVNDKFVFDKTIVNVLRETYKFVTLTWPHLDKDESPDKGYEKKLREEFIKKYPDWRISQERELNLNNAIQTSSGILHEIDQVLDSDNIVFIFELKNRQRSPDKNDIIIFYSKIVDYLTQNPDILLKDVQLLFLSSYPFDIHSLSSCLGLGIHPIGPNLRPLPVLIDNAQRIQKEICEGLQLPANIISLYTDFSAKINKTYLAINENWISAKFGRMSEDTISIKMRNNMDIVRIASDYLCINSMCDELIPKILKLKSDQNEYNKL